MEERPVNRSKFEAWLSGLLAGRAADMFRSKGVLLFEDAPEHSFTLQGVHEDYTLSMGRPWADRERISRIVFIGRDLDEAKMTADFRASVFGAVGA